MVHVLATAERTTQGFGGNHPIRSLFLVLPLRHDRTGALGVLLDPLLVMCRAIALVLVVPLQRVGRPFVPMGRVVRAGSRRLTCSTAPLFPVPAQLTGRELTWLLVRAALPTAYRPTASLALHDSALLVWRGICTTPTKGAITWSPGCLLSPSFQEGDFPVGCTFFSPRSTRPFGPGRPPLCS